MAMKVFNVGDVLTAADVNEYLTNVRFASKAADLGRNTTTTPTSDPDLSLTADASKTYDVNIQLLFRSTSATPGSRHTLTAPAGAILYGTGWGYAGASGAFTGFGAYSANAADPLTQVFVASFGANITVNIMITGRLVVAGTGGAFAVQWAQGVSNATNTTLMAGSSMLLKRVA